MKINYQEILNNNMINVLKDVLLNIKKNGLQEDHHLYITFDTNNSKVKIPMFLKKEYPLEMTIVIQYEYWNFMISKNFFKIDLSFNDKIANLEISFDSVISFADPYANFGLRLIQEVVEKKDINSKISLKNKKMNTNKNNVINFNKYKKS